MGEPIPGRPSHQVAAHARRRGASTARNEGSVYRTPAAEAAVTALYEGYVARWPVPVSELDVETGFGVVHVLVSGPPAGRPLLLLHAASMAATSWAPNVAALTRAGYRLYAPDHIGEAGKSRLNDIAVYPRTPAEVGSLYVEVAQQLGIGPGPVIGASAGGHAALRYALAAPERVTSLALLGPMGIRPLGLGAMLRMMFASLVPAEAVGQWTSRWALGSDPAVVDGCGTWFAVVLRSMAAPPRVARPVALTAAEMHSIAQPVLLVLGDHDNLVGSPERAAAAAAAFPDIRITTLHSAHLLGVERAGEVNALLVHFLKGGRS
jgi:pimeloyl-ACP methyl ester carboxylesterase